MPPPFVRMTNDMLSSAIPDLVQQVQATNDRIARLESRSRRSSHRSFSAVTRRSVSQNGGVNLVTGGRNDYSVSQSKGWRSQAMSNRSDRSSAVDGARDVLGRATNVLGARPSTAKTTKTILSHRNRHGWGNTLRDGDIVKHSGPGIPKRKGYSVEVDKDTGMVRKRPVKIRPATATGLRAPSCRRMPGYKAPFEDYGPSPPGAAREDYDESAYVRPEDLACRNPGHD